jgi:hypothetical protein
MRKARMREGFSILLASTTGLLVGSALAESESLLGTGSRPMQSRTSFDAAANPLLPSSVRLDLQTTGGGVVTPGQVSSKRDYIVPVLLSAAVPGLGEISTGHWKRGVPLVAVDIATWSLYAYFQNEGHNWRDDYEAFADIHWLYDQWQANLETYYNDPQDPTHDFYDPTQPYNCTCPYIPKEEDKQHYYENIGKYLYYYPGWDDWQYSGDPATSDSQSRRAEYASMRQSSNDNFDHASAMIVVAMLTRVGSMIQTALLVKSDLAKLEMRPVKLSGRGAGMQLGMRF